MSTLNQPDLLREAIDTCDLPALVAHYYPDSGAIPGKRGAAFAVWRGDRHKSFSLFISKNGGWLWRDHGTSESGNAYTFLTDIAGFSRAEAAAMLVEHHPQGGTPPQQSPSSSTLPQRPEAPPVQEDGLRRALEGGRIKPFVHPLSKALLSQAASEVCLREALEQPRTKDARRIINAAFQALKAAGRKQGEHGKIVAKYDYLDEREQLLFQVVRFEPKSFAQRRKAPDGAWVWGLTEGGYRKNTSGNWVLADPGEKVMATFPATPLVLYHLPQLLAAIGRGRLVFVVEGEKDVHALEALGFVATTNPGGALKWGEAQEARDSDFSESLRDADVIILADNDEAGREHAQRIGRLLTGIARTWTSLTLPNLNDKEDVSDWLKAGNTGERLLELVVNATGGMLPRKDERELLQQRWASLQV